MTRQKNDGRGGEREVSQRGVVCDRDLSDGDGTGGSGGSRKEIKQRCQHVFLGSADSMPPSPNPPPFFFLWPNYVLFIVFK